ncbi:MmgE/PrpD family protein [Chloroflexota bacterium]
MEQGKPEAPTGTLAEFTASLNFADLPEKVVHETKRTILDSAGCALVGLSVDKGKIAVDLARHLGGLPEASILAIGDRVSCPNAAFANGELMNAMDFDTILVPGHVSAFVIPATLALAECQKASGKSLIVAVAAAHEMAARVGASLRGFREGKTYPPPRFGLGACVFGAAAGAGKILQFDREQTANCFGLAGALSPQPIGAKSASLVNTPMFKYTSAGWISQCGVTGALLTERGYLGDTTILDGELGFWNMYGSDICRWERMTDKLGDEWLMMNITYKPYPIAGSVIPVVEAFAQVVEQHDLSPDEIEKVILKGEPMLQLPGLSTPSFRSHMDTQFKPFYGVAMIAYKVRACDWQDQTTMKDPKISEFMKRVSFEPYPKFDETRKQEMAGGLTYVVKKPAAAEVVARGQVFKGEVEYHKWGPSNIESMRTGDEELVVKFRMNAGKMLPSQKIDKAIEYIWGLEKQDDVTELSALLSL